MHRLNDIDSNYLYTADLLVGSNVTNYTAISGAI